MAQEQKQAAVSAAEVLQKQREYIFGNVATFYKEPLVLVRGEGKYVWDAEGRQYFDAFGGILTVSLGHVHPEVTRRTAEQLQRLQHASTLYPTAPMADLAERLANLTPGALKRSFFSNSGTEANETAILIAKLATGSDDVIALRHSYHGRSMLAMSLGGTAGYRAQAPIPGIHHAHNAYCYRCPFGLSYPSCDLRCARDMEELIQTTTSGKVAALIAEPIQGVGGFVTPPPEYFKEVVGIVRKYGGVFICDEVQTGWGRTGTYLWGIEHWGVEPEIMTSAKGMANGLPIGWTIANEEIAGAFKHATISTFGGNPVSTTAALATIDVILEEGLAENAEVVGRHLMAGLKAMQEEFPCMGDVRGMGLMIGVELVHSGKRPAPDLLSRWLEETKARGLLIGKGGLWGNTARITPHLNITRSDADEILRILRESMAEVQPYMQA